MNPKESAPKQKPTQEPDPSRFAKFTILEDESGFKIEGTDHIFLFDSEGGWFDEYGNYYNADAVPCTPPEVSLEEEEISENLEKKELSKEEEKGDPEDEVEDWNDEEEDEEDQDTYSKAYQLYKQMGGKFAEDVQEEHKSETQSNTTKASGQENRFEEFWPTDDKSGFHIDGTDHTFVFDNQEGWYDEKGNYFNADGVPKPAPEYKDKQLEKFLKDKANLEKFYVRNIKLRTAKKDFHTFLEGRKAGVDIYDIHFFNDEKNNFTGSALIATKDGSKLLSLNCKAIFSGAPLVIVKYA